MSGNICFSINWAHSQGVPWSKQEFHLFCKKSSSKNNRRNWNGCLACVPEQKWVGSRFEGQHRCSSLESSSSQLSRLRALLPWLTLSRHPAWSRGRASSHKQDSWPYHPHGQRWSGPLCGRWSPIFPLWMLQSRVGQAPSDVRNLQWWAGGERSTTHSYVYSCPSSEKDFVMVFIPRYFC